MVLKKKTFIVVTSTSLNFGKSFYMLRICFILNFIKYLNKCKLYIYLNLNYRNILYIYVMVAKISYCLGEDLIFNNSITKMIDLNPKTGNS